MEHANDIPCSRSYPFRLPPSSSVAPPRLSSVAATSASFDFSNLAFFDAPRSAPLDFRYSSSASSREEAVPSPAYTTAVPHTATFDTPIGTQPYSSSPFSALAPSQFLERRWTENVLSAEPASFVQQLGRNTECSPSPPNPTELAVNMSTLAVPYDASFGTMGSRSSFTWPAALEPNAMGGHHHHHHHHQPQQQPQPQPQQQQQHQDLHHHHQHSHHELSPMDHLPESSLTPPGTASRSITSSPPRPSLTPEQRELKRHYDHARRNSKIAVRLRRNHTHPYAQSPPMPVSDGMNLPVYATTSPASATICADAPASMPPQPSYMQPYSPPLTEPGSATVFTPTYPPPPMQHNYGMSMDYPSPFQSTSPYDPRPSPMQSMYSMPPVLPPPIGIPDEDDHVRIVHSRPKPQCWDHGCSGRQFSTFSNLLRHQREKSGQATKSVCHQCGQSFTRSTARNGHINQGKCRGRGGDENDNNDNNESTDSTELRNQPEYRQPEFQNEPEFRNRPTDYRNDSSSPEIGHELERTRTH